MSSSVSRRGFVKGLASAPAAGRLAAATESPAGDLPPLWVTLETAEVRSSGNRLTARTAAVERTWEWTGKGLVTTGFRRLRTGRQWASLEPAYAADWDYPGLIGGRTAARLRSLTAKPVRFDPFTSDHIEVVAEIHYPAARVALQYVIWVYPNAPGFRTELRVKALAGFQPAAVKPQPAPRAEYLPLAVGKAARRAIGYYNQTQRRNTPQTPLLREEVRTGALGGAESWDWASLFAVEAGAEGFCLVKESHKCVNQPGVNTGDFRCGPWGVASTGWGPSPGDFLTTRFRSCWANWAIAYASGQDGREAAIKSFDRLRYPVDPRRDIYIMANTWGSGGSSAESREAAREANVLRQIASCRDLGIDVQQIDDGWQGDQHKTWFPVKDRYPEGWKNVRAAARKAGVKLGLWAAWVIGADALRKTYDEGGFNYYKIDFANLNTYDKLEGLIDKMRRLIRHSGHTVRVNWDVTENPPRVGYYFARDLGNIYLENRKPIFPAHVVYIPHLVLRDAWQLARYTNLNRFQITVQNIERVNRQTSDAYLHNHPYCVAITLMGSPIFFQETTYYTGQARDQIRPLLALYKRHRRQMYRGYVFPIGDEPDNSSWTGFQNHDPETSAGYLTIFRELHATEYRRAIPLRFLAGKRIRLTDLRNKKTRTLRVPADGKVRFEISPAPGFLFLRYELL